MSGYGHIDCTNPRTNSLPHDNHFNIYAGTMNYNGEEDVEMDYGEGFDDDDDDDDDADAYESAPVSSDPADDDPNDSLFIPEDDPYQLSEAQTQLAGRIAFDEPPHKGRRPVAINLDGVDKTIFDLKSSGHGDKHIAGFIHQTFNVKYDSKSISTRYRRICKLKMDEKDRQLENFQTFWAEDQDEALKAAYQEAQEKTEKEVIGIRARIFQKTASELHKILPSAFFSPEACEKRFEQLRNGTEASVDLRELPEKERAAEAALRLQKINLKAVITQQENDYKTHVEIVKELELANKEHKVNQANEKAEKAKKKRGKK